MRRSYLKSCFLIPLLFLAICCGRNRSLEMQRAELVLRRAKEALVRGDHHTSRKLLIELLALETSLERKTRRAEAALLLADNYIAGAEFDSAVILCTQAQQLYRESADRNGLRAAVVAQARAHHMCGDDGKAFALLTEELQLGEALGFREGSRELRWMLVPIARAMGHAEAEQRLLAELSTDALHDSLALAKVHDGFGEMFLYRGEWDSAKSRFQASLRLAEASGDSLLAIKSLMRSAIVADKMKSTTEAFRYFTSALRRTDNTKGSEGLREEMLLRVANIYIRQGRFAGARRFLNVSLRSAIQTQNKLIEGYSLLQLGRCYASAEAGHYYNAGAALISHIGLPRANAYAQLCLGEFAMVRGRFGEAADHFRSAAASEDSALALRDPYDVLDDCERVMGPLRSPYDGSPYDGSPYDALTSLLIQLGSHDEAFAYAVKRARLDAFRVLSSANIRTQDAGLNAAMETFARARRNYIGAERQLADAFTLRSESRTLAANVQRSLMRHSRRLHDIADSIAAFNKRFRAALMVEPAQRAQIQERIPENAHLIQYVPTAGALYAFILSRRTWSVQLAAVEHDNLSATITQHLEALKRRSIDVAPANARQLEQRITETSSQLYSFFIRPIESSVKEGDTLCIVLPTNFPLIPVHALAPSSRGRSALERWPIRYFSDAEMSNRASLPRHPAVVGFGNQGGTVVDVEYELVDLRAFASNLRLYINNDASLPTLRQMRGDVLHIALDVRVEREGNPFIVLTEGKDYAAQHYVGLGELFSISPFHTVVVSNVNNGSSSSCLPRIFNMIGASDVVMNMYLPTRRAKKMFNELFYTKLLAGSPASRAYREALLEMAKTKEYSPAHVWGAFSLW